jgi:hypothetical protein
MAGDRLKLDAIEASLRAVQRGFEPINRNLAVQHDALDDDVVRRMVAGYAYIARLIDRGIDLFVLGTSGHLLELNRIVLAGTDPADRRSLAGHFAASERHFYAQGGVGNLVAWYAVHADAAIWERAASTYIRLLGTPQLYLEGNHRCGALLVSYLLLRHGHPPFVLTPENADPFFASSSVIKTLSKDSLSTIFTVRSLKKSFAQFLRLNVNPVFLAQPDRQPEVISARVKRDTRGTDPA